MLETCSSLRKLRSNEIKTQELYEQISDFNASAKTRLNALERLWLLFKREMCFKVGILAFRSV